ncbi:MAG: helix-turn-helix transcriptional regulator [Actinobacteria bacterium]|nr:helix-turn-helix transcriptional regulator [Actinomycetota bacterium]
MQCRHRHGDHRFGPDPRFQRRSEFGRGPWGGRGGGRRARRGDIRAAVLALLAERPMHGYEMIKELEERTQGAWTPSAGSIYPTLQMLEDEGLIRGEESDGKRRFTLTEAGRGEQQEKAGEEAPWDTVRGGVAPENLALGHSLRKLMHAVRQVFSADAEQQRQVTELLDETRRKVYAVLAEQD